MMTDYPIDLTPQYTITEDALYKIIPTPEFGENMARYEEVINKDTFLMLIDKWVNRKDE